MTGSVRKRSTLAALAVTLLLAPGAAHAATVSGGAGSFTYQAAPAEINDVFAFTDGRIVGFRDQKASLTAGPGCELTGEGGVDCPLDGVSLQRVAVDLGDGNDVLDATNLRNGGPTFPQGPELAFDGGDGDDDIRQSVFGTDPVKVGLTRGGPGNDRLRGGGVLEGGPGDDLVRGYVNYSHDRIDGGDGDDTLDGGYGPDDVAGGEGNDTMFEGVADCVYEGWCKDAGPPGTNYVPYDDGHLDGGPGNDRMGAGGNQSSLAGGPGDDDIISAAASADGGEGNDRMQGGPLLRGGPGDDHLSGSWFRRSNFFYAGCCGLTDILEGGPGQDRVEGAAQDAVIDGGEGADVLVPGNGTDTLSYRSRETGVKINLAAADGTGALSEEGDSAEPGFEKLEGSAGDDEIIAGSRAIAIDGWLGEDLLVGSPKADTLDGGGDDDVILGGGGNDQLDGGPDSYRDLATGKTVRAEGADTIDGGPGDDSILPRGGDDFVLAGSGNDTIAAYESARSVLHPGSPPLNYSHLIQMSGADQVWCGRGVDGLHADYADSIALDCENVSEGTPRWREVKVTPGRPLKMTIRCAWKDDRPCKGTASLRTAEGGGTGSDASSRPAPTACRVKAGTVLARSPFRIRAGRVNYVYPKLSSTAERLVRRRGCLAIHVILDFDDAHERGWRATRTWILKRAGFRIPRDRG